MSLSLSTPTVKPSSLPFSPLPTSTRTIACCDGRAILGGGNRFNSIGSNFPSSPGLIYRRYGDMLFLRKERKWVDKRERSVVCSASVFSPYTFQWISAVSSVILMLSRGTAIQKSFLAPLFALQAPLDIISWIKGEQGTWAAFLALLVRLFYFIPGELDLPFNAMLLVILAPHQAMTLRGAPSGTIISLVIAGYLAFQHFSRIGSLRKAFDQGSIIATLAIICIVGVSCLLLV